VIGAASLIGALGVSAGVASAEPPPIMCDGRQATIVGTYGADVLTATDGPE
jgi:hypothetical protein